MVKSSGKRVGLENTDHFQFRYKLQKSSSPETMGLPDLLMGSLTPETVGALKSLRSQNFTLSKTLERLGNVISGDSSKSESLELFNGSDNMETLVALQTPNLGTVEPSDCSNECELMVEPSNVVQELHLQLPVDTVQNSGCALSKALGQPQLSVTVSEDKEGRMPRGYLTTRRISAFHDNPHHCGQDAAQVSKEECLNTVASSRNKTLGDVDNLEGDEMKEANGNVMFRGVHDATSPRRSTESQFVSKEAEEELGSSGRILRSMVKTTSQLKSKDIAKDNEDFSLQDEPDQKAQGKEIYTREKVRETLRLFQATCRKFLQEEESKSKKPGERSRVDLRALKLLKEKGKCLSTGKQCLGSMPGVEIGDEFHFRAELSVIGIHRNLVSGIDYVKLGGRYIASSIVSCEGYANVMDGSDVLVYSGSGGYHAYSSKTEKHNGNQKLEGGNLALKNCIEAQTPVRVIHGFKERKAVDFRPASSKSAVTYVYDGLYIVERYWSEPDSQGFSIFKFRLRRLPGQPELAIREVKKLRGLKVHQGLCIEDISLGKEKKPIGIVNTIDDELPMPFNYITRMIYPSWYKPVPPNGCDCIDGCSDSVKCACAVKNGGEIPFNYDGAIVQAKPLVYECGPSCKCPPSCHNRVSQHGIKFELEVFKTASRGWGVRSLTSIPSGSFVCEYIGEMLEENEAEKRTNDEYLFDIGRNYDDESLWEGLSTFIPNLLKCASSEDVENAGFTVDAAKYGNVGRFLNHSCTPNLYAQNLLYDHDNESMPHVILFATEDIPALQELTYDYNYAIDQVRDSDGNIKKKNCYCGSIECTGRLY